MYTTKTTLLRQIQNGDEISWSEFYRIYKPLIAAIGKEFSLTPTDCDDLTQEVMTALFEGEALLRYDSAKGKFRTYLGAIISHKAMEMLRSRRKETLTVSTVMAEDNSQEEFENTFSKVFNAEYDHHLLSLALEELRVRVRPETYEIFQLVALQTRDIRDVSQALGIPRGTIDVYCSRCRKTLREIISEIRIHNPEFNPALSL